MKKKIRVLHIEAATDYGGSVACLGRYLKAIGTNATKNHKVLYYYGFDGQDYLKEYGVSVKTVFLKKQLLVSSYNSFVQRLRRGLKLLYYLFTEIKQADVVHLNNGPTPYHCMAIRVAKLLKKPIVMHLRYFMRFPEFTVNSLKLLPPESIVLAVSHKVKESYCAEGLPEDSIHVLYDGVESNIGEKPDECLRKELLNGRKLLVGVVGRLVRQKGIETFVRAALELQVDLPEIRYIVIGGEGKEDPGYRQELVDMAKPLGDAIVFTGEIVGDIDRYMKTLDILVMPSVEPEALGMVILEAMALNVPVVASRHGGPVEIIKESINGVFFNPGDAHGLVDAIRSLVSDDEKRKSISENAIIVLKERFDIAKSSAQYDHWFRHAYNN